jgi:hypothetical protein
VKISFLSKKNLVTLYTVCGIRRLLIAMIILVGNMISFLCYYAWLVDWIPLWVTARWFTLYSQPKRYSYTISLQMVKLVKFSFLIIVTRLLVEYIAIWIFEPCNLNVTIKWYYILMLCLASHSAQTWIPCLWSPVLPFVCVPTLPRSKPWLCLIQRIVTAKQWRWSCRSYRRWTRPTGHIFFNPRTHS